jgi:Altered inheritance of mitochondria protein 21
MDAYSHYCEEIANLLVEGNPPGTPDERIGYLATEELASRMSSPHPATTAKRRSLQYTESPLRFVKTSDAGEEPAGEDEEVIHVDHPTFALPVERNTPGSNASFEESEEVPILAADELALHPETRYMTPAIELDRERIGSGYEITPTHSRPHSRSNSIHSVPPLVARNANDRDMTGTPLEGVKEYEPLFPEDEEKIPLTKRRSSNRDEDREPRHQFRSKDVWEDAPDSHLHETVVDTPQVPEFSVPEAEHEPKEIFDSDEQARKDKAPLPEESLAIPTSEKSYFNKDVMAEMNRPSLRHRFPSQDVWEEAPESHMHTTEVENEPKDTPSIPARPIRPVRSIDGATSPSEAKKAPSIPDRPKPQVPIRPSKESSTSSTEEPPPLTRSTSKEKPPVPARPVGSKIAALRGALDLESRLQAGPQGVPKQEKEPEPEPEEEKAPLADARKGRARGPARRKPGASPSAAAEPVDVRPKVSFVSAVTIWHVDEDGVLSIGSKKTSHAVPATTTTTTTTTVEKIVQTGQQDIELPPAEGSSEPEKATIYLGGRASEKGSVVVTGGEEHVGTDDGLSNIEKTTPFSSS